jgi:hypothetical protein
MEPDFIEIDVKGFFQGKCQRRDAMVESHGLDEKSGFLENCKDVRMLAGDWGLELTDERVSRMKVRRLDVGGVKFFDFDGQGIAVNQIPGIAPEFALDILNKAGWTIQSKMFASTKGHTNEPVKPDKVIHMCVRNENILRP